MIDLASFAAGTVRACGRESVVMVIVALRLSIHGHVDACHYACPALSVRYDATRCTRLETGEELPGLTVWVPGESGSSPPLGN